MVWIVVDDDRIRVPHPTVAICNIEWRYAPVPVVEPEPARAAPRQMPHVLRSEPACKMAMLPWMVEMIVRIVASRIMTHPMIPRIHMRHIRMSRPVVKIVLRTNRPRRSMKGRGPARRGRDMRRLRHVSGWPTMRRSRSSMFAVLLSEYRHRKNEQCTQSQRCTHKTLPML